MHHNPYHTVYIPVRSQRGHGWPNNWAIIQSSVAVANTSHEAASGPTIVRPAIVRPKV